MDDLVTDLAIDVAVCRGHNDQRVQGSGTPHAGEATLVINVVFHSQFLSLENGATASEK